VLKGTLFIAGSEKKWEEEEIIKEAVSSGFHAEMILAGGVSVCLGPKGADLIYGGESITDAFKNSRIVFRRARGAYDSMVSMAILAQHWRVPATDCALSIASNLDKFHFMPSFTLKSIENIPTVFIRAGELFAKKGKNFEFPLVVKPSCGRHGEGVGILKTKDELNKFISSERKETFMVQPFLEIDEEYRVFVVGEKSLGAIRKTPKKGSVIANYAAGAKFHAANIPKKIEDEVVSLCKQQRIDIAGVDLARVGERFYLLEVNRCPEFKAFSKAAGVNVAREIVRFISGK